MSTADDALARRRFEALGSSIWTRADKQPVDASTKGTYDMQSEIEKGHVGHDTLEAAFSAFFATKRDGDGDLVVKSPKGLKFLFTTSPTSRCSSSTRCSRQSETSERKTCSRR